MEVTRLMTDTNKCNSAAGHQWFTQISEEWLRVCWNCGLKQKREWMDYTSEDL